MNKICRTCKFWEKPHSWEAGTDLELLGGYCHNPKIREDNDVSENVFAIDGLVYPYHEGAQHFWTGPIFGCVLHELQE
jgi:hypothetical protein